MKATDLLREQHRDIAQVFRKITGSGNGQRPQLVDELIAKLQLHTRLEERIFYPAIERLDTKNAQAVVLESYEEHRIVDGLLMSLPAMDLGSQQFLARVRVTQSLVEQHVQDEEAQLFKLADRLGEQGLQSMGTRMAREVEEFAQVDELLDRVTRVALQTERWAGTLLDAGMELPRRAVRAIAPSRLLRLDRQHRLAARIAQAVPRFVVDSLYETVKRTGTFGERRAA